MNKKLTQNGNSWTLYINSSFAEILGVTENARNVALDFQNEVLYISKTNDTNFGDSFSRQLIKRGGGYGLILSKPFLQLLNINPETDYVNITIKGKLLRIMKSTNY